MDFYWNAFGPVNLAIDLSALAASAFCCWGVLRVRLTGGLTGKPSWEAVRALRLGALLSLLPWALGALYLGGILGLALLSRVLWTLATVGVPLAGSCLWLKWRRAWLWCLVLGPLAFKYYGEVWEPNNLEIERVRIASPGVRRPVRIAHLSDLQTDGIRPMHLATRAAANEFDPDIVAFTGDILNHPSLIPEVREYLRGYKHRRGAFLVSGNVDGSLSLEAFSRETGFEYLDGRTRVLDIGGTRVGVLGLGIEHFLDRRVLDRLVTETERADVRVLLSHVPDAMDLARSAPIQLLLAGHTHGGQVSLPWFGPILTMSGVPRRIAAGGLHRVDGLHVLVSRGLGMEGHLAPRVRTFARPHLVLVELVPE